MKETKGKTTFNSKEKLTGEPIRKGDSARMPKWTSVHALKLKDTPGEGVTKFGEGTSGIVMHMTGKGNKNVFEDETRVLR